MVKESQIPQPLDPSLASLLESEIAGLVKMLELLLFCLRGYHVGERDQKTSPGHSEGYEEMPNIYVW